MTAFPVEPFLQPIAGEADCGPSLRYESEWDRLRELRREDDASLPTGVWQSDLKRADWAELEKLAGTLLKDRSKDLMIAVWLGEAWIQRYRLAGLASALELIVELCTRYPDTLHPQPVEGDRSWRVFPLEWMTRQYNSSLMTEVPLFGLEGAEFDAVTLHDWLQLHQRQVQVTESKQDKAAAEKARADYRKLHAALKQTTASHFVEADTAIQASLAALERLDRWCNDWLAELAPSLGPLRQTLETVRMQMEEFVPMADQGSSPNLSADTEVPEPDANGVSASVVLNGGPLNREQAYRQLSLIADFLARTEPHSPVPYVIRRAVEWGNQPLSDLLDELISADAESRRLWKLLGVLK
jgi:type VI secretion system protein ImpA